MRLDAVGGNLIERILARTNIGPWPLVHTQMAYTLARVIMAATAVGLFDALEEGPLPADEVARRCVTDPAATEKLLFPLVASKYAKARDGGYALAPISRKWLRRDSPHCLADKLLLQFAEWDWMERSEEYVRTGVPIEPHDTIKPAQRPTYQRGMRAMASGVAPELVRRLPVPKGARDMLDIGGSHGFYSVSLCRRCPELRAVVLDLPEAIEHAAPLLAAEGMGDRVVHRAADALSEDLGSQSYDLVIASQIVHHFSDAENRYLAKRVARSLRPGGAYAIIDAFRARDPKAGGQIPALLEFYFALTSQSGTWAPEEMADWQRDAGLTPRRPIRSRTAPGLGMQVAVSSR
jgi:predicted O-methyltransferase YrrM